MSAVITLSAGNGERDDNPVSLFDFFYFATDLDDFAHEFVAENVARLHGRNVAVIKMKVGPTNRCVSDAHDGIARVQDDRIIDTFNSDFVLALPAKRFHDSSSSD